MICPPSLTIGDKIGIAAPGRRVTAVNIDTSRRIFESWGLEVINAANLYSESHSYLAGLDHERISDFQTLIDDPGIKAIVCARGGYGTTRILDNLNFSPLIKKPKWIIGFSDVTALHLKLFKLGISSIHGTMPILFSKPESASSVESLRRIVMNENAIIPALGNAENRVGKVSGRIIGGNLSLIVDAIGTSSDLDTTDKILVIEEIDEYSYKVDRMMMHLKRAGKLDNLAGLVVGHMTDIKESELPFRETLQEIILSKMQHRDYPVAFDFPIGHENPNLSWVHGSEMTLIVTKAGSQLSPVAKA